MKKSTGIILLSVLFVVVFIVSALVSIMLTGSAPNKLYKVEWNNSVGKEYLDLQYENSQGHLCDLYVPTGLDKDKTQYLILYIHGGSFNSGAKEDGEIWCKYYAMYADLDVLKRFIDMSLEYCEKYFK